MYNTLKKQRSEFGFTLVEIAIVLVLLGLVIASAMGVYHNYRVNKDWWETEENLSANLNQIGGFRSVYGRYPCPASSTAVPGDDNYGHEDCSINSPGTCSDGVCTYDGNGGEVVIAGVLPFKTLNLQEEDAYDNGNIRITYAVTRGLTDAATFDMAGGGITVIDKNGESMVEPPHSAHFVIVSHGPNKIGGYTRAGNQSAACSAGSIPERENCDKDPTFLSGEIDKDFDDRIRYFSSIALAEWQLSANDPDNIHLKYTDGIALGVTSGVGLDGADAGTVKAFGVDEGFVTASGNFYSQSLCEYDASGVIDCFAPRLIAGSLNDDGIRLEAETTFGSGMSCYKPSLGKDEYMVGIENKQPICEEEIFVSCPDGKFIKGVDASGRVVCDVPPLPRCPDMPVTTTCGDNRTVLETYSGGFRSVYSGECRKITNYGKSFFAGKIAGMTFEEAEAFIATINAEDRTIVDCGPDKSTALVRDYYKCYAGNWSYAGAHERLGLVEAFHKKDTAETSYTGDDPGNVRRDHDCWCREDYRVIKRSCDGLSGEKIVVQKHSCPQTERGWTDVYTNEENCVCKPGSDEDTETCANYYYSVTGIYTTKYLLGGSIKKKYNVSCVDGVPTREATPYEIDISGCACPVVKYSPLVDKNYCPTGQTNKWLWEGIWQTGVKELRTKEWTCPSTKVTVTPPPGTKIVPSPELQKPGYWGSWEEYSPIPACECDTDLTKIVEEACPSDLDGTLKYEVEWDCKINNWEPRSEWELAPDSGECRTCSVKKPGGAADFLRDSSAGKEPGEICDCSKGVVDFCYEKEGPEQFKVWKDCPCTAK